MRDLLLPKGLSVTVRGMVRLIETYAEDHGALPERIVGEQSHFDLLKQNAQGMEGVYKENNSLAPHTFNNIPLVLYRDADREPIDPNTTVSELCDLVKSLGYEHVVFVGAKGEDVSLLASTDDGDIVGELLELGLDTVEKHLKG